MTNFYYCIQRIRVYRRTAQTWLMAVGIISMALYILSGLKEGLGRSQIDFTASPNSLLTFAARHTYDAPLRSDTSDSQRDIAVLENSTATTQTLALHHSSSTLLSSTLLYVASTDVQDVSTLMIGELEQQEHRIYLEAVGRLGNKMFQVASAIGIAAWNNRSLVVDRHTDDFLKQFLDIKHAPYSIIEKLPANSTIVQQTRAWSVDEKFKRLPERKDVKIRYYFESWRYFEHVEDVIRKLYKFPKETVVRVEKYLRSVSDGSRPIVGVHIRRQDKIPGSDPANVTSVRIPSLNYTLKAMDYFRSKYDRPQFIVCSDDIAWCRENLSHLEDVHFSEGLSAGEDLCLLANTNHTILHHGTFGWWGAWLAGGDVVYYDRCFANKIKLKLVLENFFLPRWIPMH